MSIYNVVLDTRTTPMIVSAATKKLEDLNFTDFRVSKQIIYKAATVIITDGVATKVIKGRDPQDAKQLCPTDITAPAAPVSL